MNTSNVQYAFALTKDEEIVHIDSITEEKRGDYNCLGCEGTLRPVLGKKRKKHFRHKHHCECSIETYLHRMGKKLFVETYSNCLSNKTPYIIEYLVPLLCDYCDHGPCEMNYTTSEFDLTKAFKTIEEEKKDEELIPDVLLKTKSADKIYIEIAVTHKCSEQKINSGNKIIEFFIENEKALRVVTKTRISESDEDLVFYNFKPEPKIANLSINCPHDISYFTVKSNGKCKINTVEIFKYDNILKNSSDYIKQVKYASPYVFVDAAEEAFHKGVKVKNCFLCRYHAINTSFDFHEVSRPIFCKFYKKPKTSNSAANCEIYRPDPKVFINEK